MKRWTRVMRRAWSDWLRSVLLTVLVITAFRSAVADWNDVPTGSMRPTILEGDRIVVNKLAYDLRFPYIRLRMLSWADPIRGDIVVLRSPEDHVRLVKRVVGVPGDVIAMVDNRLVINGSTVDYGRLDPEAIEGLDPDLGGQLLATEQLGAAVHPVMITPGSRARSSFAPVEIPAGSFFVMGDNRDQSLDSRYFGFVPRSAVTGRVEGLVWSLDFGHHYRPRWSRFLADLV